MSEKLTCVLLGDELGIQLRDLYARLFKVSHTPDYRNYKELKSLIQNIEDVLHLLDKRGCFIVPDERKEVKLVTNLEMYVNEVKKDIEKYNIDDAFEITDTLLSEFESAKGGIFTMYEHELHPSKRWNYLKNLYLGYEI